MLWGCKKVGTLQDAWHVARCLKRFTTWSTIDRVIIFGVGGREGGGDGVGNFCPTQAHAARDTLLMLCSELFSVTFWAGLDAMLRIFSCNLSKMAHLEDVVTLQDSWDSGAAVRHSPSAADTEAPRPTQTCQFRRTDLTLVCKVSAGIFFPSLWKPWTRRPAVRHRSPAADSGAAVRHSPSAADTEAPRPTQTCQFRRTDLSLLS